jgi:NAD(P)-dependent dehydrogenase (short-subunit alcohol dehydrogenase family)
MTADLPDLRDRVAVVTGGGRGIGAAISRRLADAGAHVVLSGRSEEALASVAGGIRERGGRADVVRCDVARPEDVTGLAAAVRELAGSAAIVVNNAGVAPGARLVDTDEEMWRHTIEVNLNGAYRVTRAFHGDVVGAGRRGRFIYIGSTASKVGMAATTAYCASKHGLLGLCRALAAELARKGPTVNCVCPGWVETDMAQQAIDNMTAWTGRSPEEARRTLEAMSPQRRFMTPEEVAAVTVFLASDAAGAVNGQAWNVDGGQVMS